MKLRSIDTILLVFLGVTAIAQVECGARGTPTSFPDGTFRLDPASLPAELGTSAMTVSIQGDDVTFEYVAANGDPVSVRYVLGQCDTAIGDTSTR